MKYEELNRIFLGANLCLGKDITESKMREYVHQMYDCGIRLIRMYPYWAHIEEKRGEYRLEAYDACFDEAKKLGMKIFFTFKPNSPPWWMGVTSSFNLDDYKYLEEPEYFEVFLGYVRHVVNRYKDEPALIAWCIWNEPRLKITTDLGECALQEYRKFLSKQYNGDIEKLNKLYFYQYSSFDEVMPPININLSDMPEKTDFKRFSTDTLSRIIGKIGAEVKRLDPNHPTHMNTHNAEEQGINISHNIWKQTKTVDFPGLSLYPKYIDRWPAGARVNAYYSSFIRSVSKDVFWITELQGGPAIYSSHTNGISCPEKEDLQLALWDFFGGGARACVFWSFTPTVRGEWALLGLQDRESERMKSVRDVFRVIEKNRSLMEAATPEKTDIYILASEASLIHDTLYDRSGSEYLNRFTHVMGQIGAHNLMQRLGYVASFIDEELFVEKGLPQNAVLIAPGCTALQTKTMSALERFVKSGGCLIADSLFAWKEEHCLVSNENISISNKIFGADWVDIADIRKDTQVVNKNGESLYPALFTRSVFSDDAKVLFRCEGGAPAVIYNSYGKGRAVRFATEVFRNSMTHDMSGAAEVLKDFLPNERKNTVWLANGDETFHMHVLHSGEKKMLVLLNYTDEEKSPVILGCEADTLTDAESDEVLRAGDITVSPRGVRLLIAEKANKSNTFPCG